MRRRNAEIPAVPSGPPPVWARVPNVGNVGLSSGCPSGQSLSTYFSDAVVSLRASRLCGLIAVSLLAAVPLVSERQVNRRDARHAEMRGRVPMNGGGQGIPIIRPLVTR